MPTLDEHEHRPIVCRACGYHLDTASGLPGSAPRKPSNNSFSLCFNCGEVSVYVVEDGEVIAMREPNFVELEIFNRKFGDVARQRAAFRAQQPPLHPHE
jgi:hypothetical protein